MNFPINVNGRYGFNISWSLQTRLPLSGAFYSSIKQRVMWEWILHQDGQDRVIKENGLLLSYPLFTVKNNCHWSLYGFRSLDSDFTMLLLENEESHLCCFCMDSLSFGETQTHSHTQGKHFSTGMLPGTDRKYVVVESVHKFTNGVINNIWDSNLPYQHNSSVRVRDVCIIVMKCKMGGIMYYTVLKCDMECRDIRTVLGPVKLSFQWAARLQNCDQDRTVPN